MTRSVLLCPGRGAYTEKSLGSLKRSLPYVERAEELRSKYGLPSLLDLDRAERFSAALHLDPINASALIWLVSMLDADKARGRSNIVCVGGNSMGWYTALAVAGAVSFEDGFRIMQGMAILQSEHAREVPGGQLLYPLVDEDWQPSPERSSLVEAALASSDGEAFLSIRLGGYAVLAASDKGMQHLNGALPTTEHGKNRYPLRLVNHGPYHTPLVQAVSTRSRDVLSGVEFKRPKITLIDGRGQRFTPWGTSPSELREYTLGAQVTTPYNFTASVRVALREHAPDELILPGPGSSLAGIVGQILIAEKWRGIDTREAFRDAQAGSQPPVVVMG